MIAASAASVAAAAMLLAAPGPRAGGAGETRRVSAAVAAPRRRAARRTATAAEAGAARPAAARRGRDIERERGSGPLANERGFGQGKIGPATRRRPGIARACHSAWQAGLGPAAAGILRESGPGLRPALGLMIICCDAAADAAIMKPAAGPGAPTGISEAARRQSGTV